MKRIFTLVSSIGLVVLTFSGCSFSEQDELRNWMQSERSRIEPQVESIPEPSRFEPRPYGGESELDPFSEEKLAKVLRSTSASPAEPSALIAPELNRRKQPLEAYPLDVMSMVGTLNRQGQRVALIKVDELLYQVRSGQYIGQNYGKITKVTELEVVLREIVQDATGEWIERPAALQLQEETNK